MTDEQHDRPTGAGSSPRESEEPPSMEVDSPEQVEEEIQDEGGEGETEYEEVEPEAVDAAFLIKTGAITAVVLTLAVFGIMQIIAIEQRKSQVAAAEAADYPELRQYEEQAREQLQSYGVVSEEEQVYHIPIQEAMEDIVRQRSGTD